MKNKILKDISTMLLLLTSYFVTRNNSFWLGVIVTTLFGFIVSRHWFYVKLLLHYFKTKNETRQASYNKTSKTNYWSNSFLASEKEKTKNIDVRTIVKWILIIGISGLIYILFGQFINNMLSWYKR